MFGIIHEEKELPSINMSMKLQGYMLGYEVLQNGIIVQSHKYAKPVKNLVVNTGKDFLLKANNSLSSTYARDSADSYPRFGYLSSTNSGVLAYCGRGSGSTAAAATDTGLQTQIGNLTNSFLSGDPNTGTRFDRENGKVIMRVTHDHETEVADRNINEIAYFGKQNSTNIMFSRIVLPSTVTVLTGQQLRTIYQLEVTVTPYTSTSVAPSITGWTTDGDYRWECAFPATSTTFETHANTVFSLFDIVSLTGTSTSVTNTTYTDQMSLCAHATDTSLCPVTMYGSAQSFNTFGTRVSNPTGSATVFQSWSNSGNSSGTSSSTISDYVNGNYYRDRSLVFEPNWTGYSSISIYAMRLFGLMYIFDTAQTKSNTQRLTLVYRISVS